MPDTPANQAAYPQPVGQKAGLGFPQCRRVALLCLGSGAWLNGAPSQCEGKGRDEQRLLRSPLDTLQPGDSLLGEACYATDFLLCDRVARGGEGVFEQHEARRRSPDFSLGEKLGERDPLIVRPKPKSKPDWMSQADYDQAPDTLRVRELHAGGTIRVTTRLCPKRTPKPAIKARYRRRWHVERDRRPIKTTLGMEGLSGKTPERVTKELWVYRLAYNLIRLLMAQAAWRADPIPRPLSFQHTVQGWIGWHPRGAEAQAAVTLFALLVMIAERRVGKRPRRGAPRAVKRRPKPFPLLSQPRQLARLEILKNGHPKKVKSVPFGSGTSHRTSMICGGIPYAVINGPFRRVGSSESTRS